MEEINNLILLDGSKTKQEISKDLKAHFKRDRENTEQPAKPMFASSGIFQAQFHNLYSALFFLL
ncbi:hypothetical protein D3C85_1379290 [compost metagenome]